MNLEAYNPDVGKFIKHYTDQVEGRNRSRKTIQTGGRSTGAQRSDKKYYIISPAEQVVKRAEAALDDVKGSVKRKRSSSTGRRRTVKKSRKTQLG